jgi:Flp pilus assembly protein TadG
MTRTLERGQSLVEFAIVVPVFMILLGGMIQFGFILWGQNSVNQVVRDAGRYAATLPTTDTAAAEKRVEDLSAQYGGPWTLTDRSAVYSGTCPPDTNQDQCWVTITATYKIPIFFPLGPNSVSSSTEFRVEPVP